MFKNILLTQFTAFSQTIQSLVVVAKEYISQRMNGGIIDY